MNPVSSESRTPSKETTQQDLTSPFDWFGRNEFLRAAQRAFFDGVLRGSHNLKTALESNRKLLDDMQDIVRRQQDIAFDLSEKFFKQTSGAEGDANLSVQKYRKSFEQLFESTSTAMRELSAVFADAQAKTVTNFSERLQSLSARPKSEDRSATSVN